MQNLNIDPDRLWDSIHETAAYGACEGGGITRLSLSDEDRLVRDWFRTQAEKLGCTVVVDQVGNMFARRPGQRPDLPPIAIGSHLDTQPTGGKFDGVLGVLSGLEILKVLEETQYATNAPLEIINWTNEEGARFAPALLASGVFSGAHSLEFARSRVDADGLTFGDELRRIGYEGDKPVGNHPLSAMFELHIEQGPILEEEGMDIGVVTGVQGVRWFDIVLDGKTGHTGATPMRRRRNALVGAAELVLAVNRLAETPGGLATVGSMVVLPNSRNVIPGEVQLSVDLRHPDDAMLRQMTDDFHTLLEAVATKHNLGHTLTPVFVADSMAFSEEAVACVEAGAAAAGLKHRKIVSGASHDAVNIARIAPTAMIFSPCLDGISHNVAEHVSKEQCARAAQTLLNAVLAFDRKLEASDA